MATRASGFFLFAEVGYSDLSDDLGIDHHGGTSDDGIAQIGFVVQIARRLTLRLLLVLKIRDS